MIIHMKNNKPKNVDIKFQKRQRIFNIIGALADAVIISFFLYMFVDAERWGAAVWAILLLIFFVFVPLVKKPSKNITSYSASVFRLISGRFGAFLASCAPFLVETRQGLLYLIAVVTVVVFVMVAVFWEDIMIRWDTR